MELGAVFLVRVFSVVVIVVVWPVTGGHEVRAVAIGGHVFIFEVLLGLRFESASAAFHKVRRPSPVPFAYVALKSTTTY